MASFIDPRRKLLGIGPWSVIGGHGAIWPHGLAAAFEVARSAAPAANSAKIALCPCWTLMTLPAAC